MKIENNKFVSVTYTLIVGEADGEATVMEQATAERPLSFIPGLGMMLPKFEEQLKGLEQGESFDFKMEPEDAYGMPEKERIVNIPLDVFKDDKGNIDYKEVAVDHTLPMMDSEGNVMHGTITAINKEKNNVTMDFNHPLAGETLHFVGEVVEVREATANEMAAATQPQTCGGCHGCHGGGDGKCEGGCGGDGKCEGGCGDKKGGCCHE